MLSGTTTTDATPANIREWTGSNPGTGKQIGNNFQTWFGRALFATQSYFITPRAINNDAKIYIQNGEDDSPGAVQLPSANAQLGTNPMPLAYGKGKALIGRSHYIGKSILDLDFSDLNNPTISNSGVIGTSGYRFNGTDFTNTVTTTTRLIDAVYD